jgi:hypothetical protein
MKLTSFSTILFAATLTLITLMGCNSSDSSVNQNSAITPVSSGITANASGPNLIQVVPCWGVGAPALNCTINSSPGNMLLVLVAVSSDPNSITVSDNLNEVWVNDISVDDSNLGIYSQIYRVASAVGGTTQISLTGRTVCGENGGCPESVYILEVSGTGASLDQVATFYNDSSSSLSIQTPELTQASEFAITTCGTFEMGSVLSGPEGGFSGLTQINNGNYGQLAAYQITSSTEALSANWSISNTGSVGCVIATYP